MIIGLTGSLAAGKDSEAIFKQAGIELEHLDEEVERY